MSVLDEMVSPTTEAGGQTDKSPTDFETLRKKIFGNPKSKNSKHSKSPAQSEAAIESKELDELFAGENWEAISSMYFDARFAITGCDVFLLDPAQKKTLGLTLGKSMKMLLKIDPGYIALTVFITTFGGLVAQKELTYKAIKKEMDKKSGIQH